MAAAAAALRPRGGGGGAAVLTAAAAPGAAPGSGLAAPVLRSQLRYGLHGEAAGRQGAAGRHGAADSADRGEPEPALAHGERGRPGRGGRRERPGRGQGMEGAGNGGRRRVLGVRGAVRGTAGAGPGGGLS